MAQKNKGLYIKLKRLFDIVCALSAFILLWPLFAVIWLVSCFKLGRPAIFSQTRAGKDGKPFRLYKFRSMTNERGPDGELLPDNMRLTAYGKFLRATSLDELPQMWNVLRGDMSLVGPRPLLMEYLPLYTPEHYKRHDVTPGITGWAQVNGRSAVKWSAKFEYDAYYAENISFKLDAQIILKTVQKILFREDNPAGVDTVDFDDLGFWKRINAEKAAKKNGEAPKP